MQAVHSSLDAMGDARNVRLYAPGAPQRFAALRRPASTRHSGEQIVCFLLCVGRKFAPQIVQAFVAFTFRVPSRWSAFTWQGAHSTSTTSGVS